LKFFWGLALNRHIKFIISLLFVLSAQIVNASIETNRKITTAYSNSFLQQAKANKAVELLQTHLSEDTQDSSNWSLLGKAYLQDNQNAKAVDAYKNAVKVASNEEAPAINYSLAQAQAKNLQTEDAKKSLKLAVTNTLARPAKAASKTC
jgi:cytochrome c-type biogenesis protein CcmH/NrfG